MGRGTGKDCERNGEQRVGRGSSASENIDRNNFFSVKEERRTRGYKVTLTKKQS